MRRIGLLALALLLALFTAPSGRAAPSGCTNAASLVSMGFEQITVSSTALGFTATVFAPAGQKAADMAVITVETNAIRARDDGLNPTATVGQPIAAAGTAIVCGESTLRKIKFIRQSADATLDASYYRTGDQ